MGFQGAEGQLLPWSRWRRGAIAAVVMIGLGVMSAGGAGAQFGRPGLKR